jgi:hypothetical protein
LRFDSATILRPDQWNEVALALPFNAAPQRLHHPQPLARVGACGASIPTIPVTFFGQHFSSPSNDWPSSPVQIGAMGKCAGATWPWIESSNGVYNWSTLDGCDNTGLAHGVSYFESDDCTSSSSPAGCTNGIPNWTSCSSLATDFGNFIQAKVNRYGTKMIYELWNEPQTVNCSTAQFVAAINAANNWLHRQH